MRSVILMDPFRCRMWDLHDRFEAAITEQSCKAEIESFQRHGQLVPVLGRPIRGDPQHEVELIYGGRRLFVARHLNKQILVEMRPMTDREAIVAMDIENRQRLDISPFERGFSYTRWLRMGLFTFPRRTGPIAAHLVRTGVPITAHRATAERRRRCIRRGGPHSRSLGARARRGYRAAGRARADFPAGAQHRPGRFASQAGGGFPRAHRRPRFRGQQPAARRRRGSQEPTRAAALPDSPEPQLFCTHRADARGLARGP